jgi:uridine monophosphate synthetase
LSFFISCKAYQSCQFLRSFLPALPTLPIAEKYFFKKNNRYQFSIQNYLLSRLDPAIMPGSTSTIPYEHRSSTHPLSNYLFRLMTHKKSNLCLSADVSSSTTLLHLASTLGPSIVILKTHYDLVSDWDSHPKTGTGAQLASLARKHGFLLFEDRKFSDIGSTVQRQYTDGPGKIVEWAHITNAHVLPGPAIVTALRDAAGQWREKKKCEVKTDITVGTPRPESEVDSDDDPWRRSDPEDQALRAATAGRKASIVSITTVSQSFEPANSTSNWTPRSAPEDEIFPGIEEPPLERGLLLLAQMSSANNLLLPPYTAACVDMARQHKDFVMGYIAQESLNTTPEDQFISMTPGCQLPPESASEATGLGIASSDASQSKGDKNGVKGDGMGQQYNTPQKLIGLLGTDIVIVGRGILKAADPVAEAERYRVKAWEAYEERISKS